MEIIPHVHEGQKYYSVRQFAGILDIASPITYKVLQDIILPSFKYKKGNQRKNSYHKMIPVVAVEKIYRDFMDLKIRPVSDMAVYTSLRPIVKKYLTGDRSHTIPAASKVVSAAKRFFTALAR